MEVEFLRKFNCLLENLIKIIFKPHLMKKIKLRKGINSFFPLALYLMACGLVATSLYYFSPREVTVYVEKEKKEQLITTSRTIEELAEELETKIYPNDRVEPGSGELIKDTIHIERAFPVFVLTEQSLAKVWTPPGTVKDVLNKKGTLNHFEIAPGDLDKKVKPNMQIHLQEEKVQTTELPKSNHETWDRTSENTRGMAYLSREGTSQVSQAEKTQQVLATAYCPGTAGAGCPIDLRGHSVCTGQYNSGFTYTGKKAATGDGSRENPYLIAVDPKTIPLGSTVYLEGYGFAVAEDIGGAIKGNRIDLLKETHQEALNFGTRVLQLYIISP